jgi:hypothetical protein
MYIRLHVKYLLLLSNCHRTWIFSTNFGKRLFTRKLDSNLKKNAVKFCIRCTALSGAESWTLRKVDQKHVKSSEMWCWRRMGNISWTDRVRNEEVLHRIKEERNILLTIKSRKATWIGHMLRKNCLLQHMIEGKVVWGVEVRERDEEEDVRSYWMTIKRQGTGNWRRKR